jgi:hypothetical protein
VSWFKSSGRSRQWICSPDLVFCEIPEEADFALYVQTNMIGAVREDKSTDILRKCALVGAYKNTTDRRADKNIRPSFPGGPQECMEIGDRLLGGFICGAGIAPRKSSPIIGANPCLLSDSRLNESPVDREGISASD